MNRFAKQIAVLLIVAMFAAFGLPAFADDTAAAPTTGTITVIWPTTEQQPWGVDGGDYEDKLWKIFDATVGSDAISYTCTDAQKEIAGFDTFFEADAANNVSAKPAAIGPDGMLSPEAADWIRENIEALGTKVDIIRDYYWINWYNRDPNMPYYESRDGRTVFHTIPFGYYYLESGIGSVVMLSSTNPDMTVADKNKVPPFEKTITGLTDADGEAHNQDIQSAAEHSEYYYWKPDHGATAQIGDTVSFSLDTKLFKGSTCYSVGDSQTRGLTLKPETIKVTAGERVLTAGEDYVCYAVANPRKLYVTSTQDPANSSQYINTVISYTGDSYSDHGHEPQQLDQFVSGRTYWHSDSWGTDDFNFLIVFKEDFLDSIEEETALSVTYDCIFNEHAIVASSGGNYHNNNDAQFQYGHDGQITDRTDLYTAKIVVYKYEGDGESSSSAGNKPLNGVKFILQRQKDGKYFKIGDDDHAVHWVESRDEATVGVTGGEGQEVTTTWNIDGWILNNIGPGRDGQYGTADDCYAYHDYYGTNTYYYVGPDCQVGTADDYYVSETAASKQKYTPGPDGVWGTGDELTTIADGYLEFLGLTNGTYTLIEVEALPGYNVAAPVTVVIDNHYNSFSELKQQVDIANHTGTELPTTGGMGVTLFYVLGGMCVLLGAALLTRKKNTAEG